MTFKVQSKSSAMSSFGRSPGFLSKIGQVGYTYFKTKIAWHVLKGRLQLCKLHIILGKRYCLTFVLYRRKSVCRLSVSLKRSCSVAPSNSLETRTVCVKILEWNLKGFKVIMQVKWKGGMNKELSCSRETAQCFMSLNISLVIRIKWHPWVGV